MADNAEVEVEWGDPPPTTRGTGGVWNERLAKFRQDPGTWGRLVGDYPRATASQIRKGVYKGIEPGEYDATVRTLGDGEIGIWVRYVGKPDTPEVAVDEAASASGPSFSTDDTRLFQER